MLCRETLSEKRSFAHVANVKRQHVEPCLSISLGGRGAGAREKEGEEEGTIGKMLAMQAGRPQLNPRNHMTSWVWWFVMSALEKQRQQVLWG